MAQAKPKIAILATGGTIASSIEDCVATTGYSVGGLSVENLISGVKGIEDLATITTKQISNIDSANMRDEIWLKLAKEINQILDSDFDGVVITHGTDTMEETAYFLHLTIKSYKPVILVGAMRPSNSVSSDGAKNLYNAVALAANKESKFKGVMVTMNDKILSARGVTKTHTLNLDAFSSPDFGDLGYMVDGKAYFYSAITKAHTTNTPFNISQISNLPKVDILYSYSNDGNAVAARALFANGTKGLIIAGSGAGSIHEDHEKALKELINQGLKVVVSSRISQGRVALNSEKKSLGFISAEELNPQKARVLLMLSLIKTDDISQIQDYFLKY
ncbi:MAG: asparaginase [Campylobacter lanienae]|uniref:asparaginase n=1 Tax=Campylobacter lanienae TaxID=75658 RepID=UPI00242EC64C|nr:asparaginase [Campylobacter lanienae]MCI7363407.1 asparaginase [Campylobacter lanienae]